MLGAVLCARVQNRSLIPRVTQCSERDKPRPVFIYSVTWTKVDVSLPLEHKSERANVYVCGGAEGEMEGDQGAQNWA